MIPVHLVMHELSSCMKSEIELNSITRWNESIKGVWLLLLIFRLSFKRNKCHKKIEIVVETLLCARCAQGKATNLFPQNKRDRADENLGRGCDPNSRIGQVHVKYQPRELKCFLRNFKTVVCNTKKKSLQGLRAAWKNRENSLNKLTRTKHKQQAHSAK
jgi:hypothetical protein